MKNFKKLFILPVIFGMIALHAGSVSAATPKIVLLPNPATISEGNSQTITITLSEPIIATSGPGTVELNFVSSDPTRVTLSPASFTFHAASWAEPQTFTVHTMYRNAYNDDEDVTISAAAISDSEYYSGYNVSTLVSVRNIDPDPAAATIKQTYVQDAPTVVAAPPATTTMPVDKSHIPDNMLHPGDTEPTPQKEVNPITPIVTDSAPIANVNERNLHLSIILPLLMFATLVSFIYVSIKKQWFIWRVR